MSYRELRNFKEIMCTLGYPRLISIENFRAFCRFALAHHCACLSSVQGSQTRAGLLVALLTNAGRTGGVRGCWFCGLSFRPPLC